MQKIIIGLAPNTTVEISSENIKHLVEQASFWNSLPHECPLCGAPLVLFSRTVKDDNSYWGQACTGNPIHEANFGVSKKEEKGFYYKGDWQRAFDAYQNAGRGLGDNGNGNGSEQTQSAPQGSPFARTPAPAGHPVAGSLADLITTKQLNMIRAISRELGIDFDDECSRLMGCRTDELSKRGASDFIDHLQMMQRDGIPGRATEPVYNPAPANAAPATVQESPAPPRITPNCPGASCPGCVQCDIPF